MEKAIFKWNAKYEVGLAEVDAQHRGLVDLINRLGDLRARGANAADVKSVLEALSDYAKYHFATEEALMTSAGISVEHHEAHSDAHIGFLEPIDLIVAEAQGDVMVTIDRLLRHLVRWLAFHILGQDTEMAVEIAALQQGASPAAAAEKACEHGKRSTEVLFDALNVLYDDLGESYAELALAQAKLLQSTEAQLKEAQRLAHLGSWELDLASSHLKWSDEIYRIFEIDPERFDASYEAFVAAIHPEDRDKVDAAYRNSLETRQPYQITHRLRMPDGRIKHVHERCNTHYDAAGAPLRSLGTVQDVTQNVLLEEKLRDQAQSDYLTGLANRRHFVHRAEVEIARTARYGHPLSLMMLDIDHFKAVNDAHGHHQGDIALQLVASQCQMTLREGDVLGRLGGEEFAAILPETGDEGARSLAQRLRAAIASETMTTTTGDAVGLTVSIGLATLAAGDTCDLEVLLKQADAALYEAKRSGRDCVCAYTK